MNEIPLEGTDGADIYQQASPANRRARRLQDMTMTVAFRLSPNCGFCIPEAPHRQRCGFRYVAGTANLVRGASVF